MLRKFKHRQLVKMWAFGMVAIAVAGCWYSLRTSTVTTGANRPHDISSPASVKSDYGNLPLSFEPNKGQTAEEVKFLARSSGYTLFLTGNEAVLRFQNQHKSNEASTLRLSLKNANPKPQVAGLSELPGKTNYFIGNDPTNWRTDIPTYAKVKYESIYPGVDLVYYSTQGRQLEYDFVVGAGTDPRQIKLSFEGADEVQLADGDIVMKTRGREIRMHKPVVYQEKNGTRELIPGQYTLSDERELAFDIGAYDKARELVIDPVLAYSTFLGGTGEDTGIEIAVNAHGNAFVTGLTTSLDFPTKPDGARFGIQGGSDVFITKFNAAGNQLIYSTYLGGSNNENFYDVLEVPGVTYGGIALDSQGSAYVTGSTRSADFPHTGGAYQQTLKGLSDTFVTKLNPLGNSLLYSTFLGQNGVNAADGGQGIAVDFIGQAYVTGFDYSGGLPVNGFANHSAGCDGYVAKLNPNGGNIVYATYFGGDACNLGWNIAIDQNQNAFVSGETVSTNFPTTPGAFDTMCGTDGQCNDTGLGRIADFFITKVDTQLTGLGSLSYSTYLGGSGEERVTYNGSIAVNSAGDLMYVTGLTASTNPADFPIKNAMQPLPGGNADAFITKFDISLPLKSGFNQLVYSTYLGGPGAEIGTGIAADVDGNAYISGASGGTFPSTEGQPGCIDPGVFVTKLNSTGEKQFAMCISGLGQDTGLDIAIDPSGCAYVTGFTESNNYPTVKAFQSVFAGGTGATPSDAFVSKLCTGPDHFKCYDVRAEDGFLPFTITLVDQFEREQVLVQRPVTLCNPVAKCVDDDHNSATPPDCTPVLNPDDHLVCYETRDDSGNPTFERREVIVSNQFGQAQRLTVLRRTNLMCIPSLKAQVRRSP
ncbi:MAG TPA: SBBP repeat-containing protein [Pyrinomonadaceae bacterium]|nr:SBBP repeat-containing protein [Pyrinomonadaceae bacterium]